MRETSAQVAKRAREEALKEAAEVCDRVALSMGTVESFPNNRRSRDPKATYKSGACKCAWEIRQLARKT